MIWVVLILLLATVALAVGIYNGLVQARNAVRNAFAQIDVQLTRRHELIPNLVEIAKGYLHHERDTLEAVITARNAAMAGLRAAAANPGSSSMVGQFASAENALTGALGRLLALVESYPDLKADETMLQLSEELTTTENKVSFARQAFNDAVMAYNNLREYFPNNIIAGNFGFSAASPLDLDTVQKREVPKISFAS